MFSTLHSGRIKAKEILRTDMLKASVRKNGQNYSEKLIKSVHAKPNIFKICVQYTCMKL